MAEILPWPRQQFFDDNGDPLAGGKLYSYKAGSSVPLTTYADKAGSVPNANPVVLNARGEALIYLSAQAYKLVLKDANDVQIWSIDSFVVTQTDSTTLAQAIADAQTAQAAAATSEANAASSATSASGSAAAASTSATNAASSASSASTSASTATTQATNAAASAANAAISETAAGTSATNAASSASLASDWATKTTGAVSGGEYSAKKHAQDAAASASSASTSATNASSSASSASTSATNAASSATAAASSASNATTQATNASNSASAASTSATNAANSASAASTSATNASNSASAASTSASNASTSATNAANSATTATTQATNAANSATAAAASATSAAAADVPSLLTTTGDLVARGASGLVRLAVGTNGQILQSDSTQSSGMKWTAPGILSVVSKTTTYTATTSDDVILCDASGGAWTLSLHTAVGNTGKVLRIKKTDSSTNVLTIDGNSTETIDGLATIKLGGLNSAVSIASDGSNWRIISDDTMVGTRCTTAAGQSIPYASGTVIDFGTKAFDYTGNVSGTGTSWKFTVDRPGLYHISASMLFASGGGWAAGEGVIIILYVNGATALNVYNISQTTHAEQIGAHFDTHYRLALNDYVQIGVYQNSGASLSLAASAAYNYASIVRIGD